MILLFMLLYTGWVEVDTTVDTLCFSLYNSLPDSNNLTIVSPVPFWMKMPDSSFYINDTARVGIFVTKTLKLVSNSDKVIGMIDEGDSIRWIYPDPDTFTFVCRDDYLVNIWAVDLALRAREGDKGAGALLDFWANSIKDSNGKLIYGKE